VLKGLRLLILRPDWAHQHLEGLPRHFKPGQESRDQLEEASQLVWADLWRAWVWEDRLVEDRLPVHHLDFPHNRQRVFREAPRPQGLQVEAVLEHHLEHLLGLEDHHLGLEAPLVDHPAACLLDFKAAKEEGFHHLDLVGVEEDETGMARHLARALFSSSAHRGTSHEAHERAYKDES
jgi:hypothetical protein